MKTTHFLLKLLIIALLSSCSSDDEAPEAEKTESFRIKAITIRADEMTSTEGDVLEIYGTLWANLKYSDRIDERILLNRTRSNWVPVGLTETSITFEDTEHIFTLTEEEIRSGARLRLLAKLWDKDPDGNPDDYLGNGSVYILAGPITVVTDENNPFRSRSIRLTYEDGIIVIVDFTIEHIRD
tara:strand:+ start:18659 stop:19207 length:549 start_codon:yes stop_codon:yes gene_type:complete